MTHRSDHYSLTQQQNKERRLRNARWEHEREPVLPTWSLWLAAAFLSPFVAAWVMAG